MPRRLETKRNEEKAVRTLQVIVSDRCKISVCVYVVISCGFSYFFNNNERRIRLVHSFDNCALSDAYLLFIATRRSTNYYATQFDKRQL